MSATNYAALAEADMRRLDWEPEFSPWRHGGWYVDNIRYPSGAVGCVSRSSIPVGHTEPDGRWRIVCDERSGDRTYPSRIAAAKAERHLVLAEVGQTKRPDPLQIAVLQQLVSDHALGVEGGGGNRVHENRCPLCIECGGYGEIGTDDLASISHKPECRVQAALGAPTGPHEEGRS